MIVHSLAYLVFLALVLALYWSLARSDQNCLLIFANYLFHGWEHSQLVVPLLASTLAVSWREARRRFSTPRPRESQSPQPARRKIFGGVLRLRRHENGWGIFHHFCGYYQGASAAWLPAGDAAAHRSAAFHSMVSSDASRRVTQGRWRLTIFVAAVLLLPALIAHIVPARRDFDPKPIARLRSKQPEAVLIGDSILNTSIDPRIFGERTGLANVELLWGGGAASAAWYLLLKNYVVASGTHPRVVCIFFRDRLMTDATFRTTGTFRRFLDSVRHDKEPVFSAVLERDAVEEQSALGRAINWLYPLNERRHVQQETISRLAFLVAAGGEQGIERLQRRVNRIFDVAKLRDGVMLESSEVSREKPADFTADPKRNFLPHMVETAKQAGIPLCFVREKRHPLPNGTVPQNDALQRYVVDLRAWLESQGCAFVDLTNNSEPTKTMYRKDGDDHIRPEEKEAVTEIYARKLRPLLRP